MFDSLKSVPASDLIALVIAGAILAALLLRKGGYLVLPSDRPVKQRPAAREAERYFESLSAKVMPARPVEPAMPAPSEPRSAQQLLEDHRRVQGELQRRKQWHESELATINNVLATDKPGVG